MTNQPVYTPENPAPSSLFAARQAQAAGKPLPDGELIASFGSRQKTREALEYLNAQGYPVSALYVINEGIQQVEYPAPRPYSRVIISNVVMGAVIGCIYTLLGDLSGDIMLTLIKNVGLAVVIFFAWALLSLRMATRRQGSGSIHMVAENIPSRVHLYALRGHAGPARSILGSSPLRSHLVNAGSASSSAPAPAAPAAPVSQFIVQSQTAAPAQEPALVQAPAVASVAEDVPEAQTASATQSAPAEESKPAQRYGLRIDDPEEYAKTIRRAPKRD
ncbi:MAG: hypothetical protein Q4P78_02705 [Rothia sp. (in: high G+C Gram-positive bacteria)]|uniref:general stress protein n=1 Tax=Rothia sp. (in: high G+C Gram-positive bacteria) TaxID=1885016 RepID=UPI0026DF3754|nr:general stress protein [Rothia sp. (in: high G+C Gram-positive bacteria)]MDO5750099.1 hypothetical protein [Rothia sp. (in: high G+C Gram-positive bacteria)]